jgi:hypothetical protein
MISFRLIAWASIGLVAWVVALTIVLSMVDFSSKSKSWRDREKRDDPPDIIRNE